MDLGAVSWWDLASSPLTGFPSWWGGSPRQPPRGPSPSGLLQVWVLCLQVIFTVICLTKGLVGISQLQREKLYGFSSHQSESSQEMYPPGGALLRFQCLFLSLRKWQSWKLQPTAPLSPLNSSFLSSAIVPPSSFILIPGSCTRSSLRKRAWLPKGDKSSFSSR